MEILLNFTFSEKVECVICKNQQKTQFPAEVLHVICVIVTSSTDPYVQSSVTALIYVYESSHTSHIYICSQQCWRFDISI